MEYARISQSIHDIRGQKVMLDFDLAELYEVGTKALNQAIKRNLARFPLDFMFKLSVDEWEAMRSQFVTSSPVFIMKRKRAYAPYAFTEHGVTMLASVLRSERAVKMNIAIVRAFVMLRNLSLQPDIFSEKLELLRRELKGRLAEHDTQLAAIYDTIENLLDDKAGRLNWESRERIGFNK
jgi:phage regulator Rha-like protein